jgi:hypothetical protein
MVPPKATGEAVVVPRKSHNRALAAEPEIEETPGASSSEPRFPPDYIPPRKDDAPPVTLQKTPDYTLVTLDIPEEVIIDEDMLGKVPQLKYAYHDIIDVVKFPELAPHEYLELKVDPLTQVEHTSNQGLGQRIGVSRPPQPVRHPTLQTQQQSQCMH